MQPLTRLRISLAWLVLSMGAPALAQMHLEYIAHAAFVIESPAGHRIVLDPYNGHIWLGYDFPTDVTAEAVAITHPHYDHDASYYFDASTPVFREPGRYRIGDIALEGIPGEHAGAERFRSRGITPFNTIWVVETGGIRLAHLGDNGPLSADTLSKLGHIDVLIARASGSYDALAPVLAKLGVSVLVPNHYRIPEISNMPEVLKSVDEWLGERDNVERLPSNTASYARDTLPRQTKIQVLAPSKSVRVWSESLRRAWKEIEAAQKSDEPIGRYEKAVALAPTVMKFHWLLAKALAEGDRAKDAVRVLEKGIAAVGNDDWTDEVRARALLASLYAADGKTELAEAQYRVALRQRQSYAAEAIAAARRFVEKH